MVSIKPRQMEVFFGLFGVVFLLIILPITAYLTPGFTPLRNTISSLAEGRAKSLFGIGFVVCGSFLIPFYIYLERELVNVQENVRRLATGASIFTNACIALVGITPDTIFVPAFQAFHAFVAIVSFVGSGVYIVLYSILIYQGPMSLIYKGPVFKKYLAYFGFIIGILLAVFLITQYSLLEWIVGVLIIIWVLITALQCIFLKFSKLPGLYYKRSEYPKALKLFEDAVQMLNNLEMGDEPIMETLRENIEFIKSEMENKSLKPNEK